MIELRHNVLTWDFSCTWMYRLANAVSPNCFCSRLEAIPKIFTAQKAFKSVVVIVPKDFF